MEKESGYIKCPLWQIQEAVKMALMQNLLKRLVSQFILVKNMGFHRHAKSATGETIAFNQYVETIMRVENKEIKIKFYLMEGLPRSFLIGYPVASQTWWNDRCKKRNTPS
jgi:hypothetical protein